MVGETNTHGYYKIQKYCSFIYEHWKISSVPNETGASEVLLTFLQDVTTKIIVDL
jgi:hypothetical protein